MSTETSPAEESEAQAPSFRLFDRERMQAHPWRKAFAELASPNGPAGRWAVAENWQMDHRVCPERESKDVDTCSHFAAVTDAEDWWAARHLYFEEEIRGSRQQEGEVSAFLRPPNEVNRIRRKISPFDRLIHVGCLDSLVRWAARSAGAADADAELRDLFGHGLPLRRGELTQSLLRPLLNSGEEVIRSAIGILSEAQEQRQGPWWAGFADEIQEAWFTDGGRSLCAALGLGHRRPGDWLVVWVYPVSVAGPLYRPTVLEANDSPYHYPSPPDVDLGITMPLRIELPACREVLHEPLRGDSSRRYCSGRLLQVGEFPTLEAYDVLRGLREHHLERLRNEASARASWLDRHTETS